MKKTITILLMAIILFLATGAPSCDTKQAESVQRKFALNTNRVASGTNDALRGVDQLVTQKLITLEQGRDAVQLIRKANAVNGVLIDTASSYISVIDGKRVFVLTDEGVVNVSEAIDNAVKAFDLALSDPVISQKANPELSLLARTLALAVKALLDVKKQLRPHTLTKELK